MQMIYNALKLERNAEVKFSQCYCVMVFYAPHILLNFTFTTERIHCY